MSERREIKVVVANNLSAVEAFLRDQGVHRREIGRSVIPLTSLRDLDRVRGLLLKPEDVHLLGPTFAGVGEVREMLQTLMR